MYYCQDIICDLSRCLTKYDCRCVERHIGCFQTNTPKSHCHNFSLTVKKEKWSCNNKYNPLGSVLTSSLSPDTENVADYLSVTGKLDWMRELPYTSRFCSYYLFPITQKKVTEEFRECIFCCLLGNIAYLMIRQFTVHLNSLSFPFFYVITTVRWPSNIAYFRHTIHF